MEIQPAELHTIIAIAIITGVTLVVAAACIIWARWMDAREEQRRSKKH